MKAAEGLEAKPGPKSAKLYNANALFMSIYCGKQPATWWQILLTDIAVTFDCPAAP